MASNDTDSVGGLFKRDFKNSVCHPCSEENVVKSGDRYCLQCDMYMCGDCLTLHNKFPPNRSHTITASSIPSTSETSVASSTESGSVFSNPGDVESRFPFERCLFHEEERVNVYCEKHDVVCCSFCIAVDHRDCNQNQIKYIRNIDCSVKNSERIDVEEDIRSVKNDIDKVMKLRLKDRDRIENDRAKIKKEIIDYKDKLVRKLEDAIRNTMTQIDVHYGKLSADIETDINVSMEAFNHLETVLDHVPKQSDEDIKKFIFIKYGKKSTEVKKAEIDGIKRRIGKEQLFFTPNDQISKLLGFISTLGDVSHSLNTPVEKDFHFSASKRNEVKFSRRLDVIDVCQLHDGQRVLADKTGCRIVRLNHSLDFSDECACFREPTALCPLNPNEVCVALEQGQYGSIAVVTLKPDKMTINRIFFVGPVCHGLVHHSGLIYVTTGGKFMDAFGSQIRVFNTFGIFVKNIKSDVSVPLHIKSVSEQNSLFFYVAGERDGLTKLDKDGKKLGVYKYKNMKKTSVLSSSSDSVLFILDNSNVFHFVPGQESPQLILKGSDFKPSTPKSLLYDGKNMKLVVFTDREVREYQLSKEVGADGGLSLSRKST